MIAQVAYSVVAAVISRMFLSFTVGAIVGGILVMHNETIRDLVVAIESIFIYSYQSLAGI